MFVMTFFRILTMPYMRLQLCTNKMARTHSFHLSARACQAMYLWIVVLLVPITSGSTDQQVCLKPEETLSCSNPPIPPPSCPSFCTRPCRTCDACASNPCQNNGICINVDSSYPCNCTYRCNCTLGFAGTNCQLCPDFCELCYSVQTLCIILLALNVLGCVCCMKAASMPTTSPPIGSHGDKASKANDHDQSGTLTSTCPDDDAAFVNELFKDIDQVGNSVDET